VAVSITSDEQIVTVKYEGIIKDDDLSRVTDQVTQLLNTKAYYIIFDLSEVMYTKEGNDVIQRHRQRPSLLIHPNIIVMVYVFPMHRSHERSVDLQEYITSLGTQEKIRFCETREEAHQLIANLNANTD